MNKKEYYLTIDGQKVPVSKEVYRTYWHYTEKEKYFMGKLKHEKFVSNQENETVVFIPGREDSLDRLLAMDVQFPDSNATPGEEICRVERLEELASALSSLTAEEFELIRELFFLEKTEREVSKAHNLAKTTLHREKEKILRKLKNELQKKNF